MNPATILLADNLPAFVEERKEILEEAGYRVLTASGPEQARQILEKERVDLAVLDIRLRDDRDPQDRSGLDLARTAAPQVPKIILTNFPTWEAVREAFGAELEFDPPVVDFIAKREDASRLLQAIRWTLGYSGFKHHLYESFQVPSLLALQDRWESMEEQEAGQRLQRSLERTTEELTAYREEANRRAAQYHFWGLAASILAIGLIFVGVVLTLSGAATASLLPVISGAVAEGIGTLLHKREEAAHGRVRTFFTQLEEVNQLTTLLSVCDTLDDNAAREKYKGMLITRLSEKWFGSNPL